MGFNEGDSDSVVSLLKLVGKPEDYRVTSFEYLGVPVDKNWRMVSDYKKLRKKAEGIKIVEDETTRSKVFELKVGSVIKYLENSIGGTFLLKERLKCLNSLKVSRALMVTNYVKVMTERKSM